jgi:DtxR family Mn-dependent transcriptional regulator
MVQHRQATSEAEEMYLITIATAIEDGHPDPIPVSFIADRLSVSGVSANQMIRKLASRELVVYEPYRGVSLTPSGGSVASSILRSRRLWGVFLADRLGLSAGRADEIACDLEHVTPGDVADRLSDFLGDPMAGPKGRAIPSGDGPAPTAPVETLSDSAAGSRHIVVAVDVPSSVAAFLEEQGLMPGVTIKVLGVGAHGDRLVSIDGTCLDLDVDVTDGIVVEAA